LGGNILYLWVSKSPSIGGFRGRKSIIYDRAKYIAVVHTERKDHTRIISARKATKYEQLTYFEQLSN